MNRAVISGVLLSVLVLFLPSTSWAGGPWLWKQFSGFVQVQANVNVRPYNALLMSHFRDTKQINRTVFGADFSAYAEFGILDSLDIMVGVPLKYASTGDVPEGGDATKALAQGSVFGLSNPLVGLKYGILNGKVKLATSFQFQFNPISQDLAKGLSTGYDTLSFALFFHLGGNINQQLYMFFEAGFAYRTNNFSHVVDAKFELGYNFWKPLSFIFTLNFRKSLENGSFDSGNLLETGLYPNNQDWLVGEVKLMYQSKWGFGASIGTGIVPIFFKNIGFTGAVALGLHYRW